MALFGLSLIITAVILSSQWYFELPLPANIDRFPVTGITLFKVAFILEGMVLLFLAAAGWQYQRMAVSDRLADHTRLQADSSSTIIWGILAITGLAIILRSSGLSQSFWIDEVVTLQYTTYGFLEQLTVFVSPNNHLLNTLLIKLSIALFGENEWSVRLPAVLFGVGTIPVLFWLIRRSMGAWPALAVTLLLAVSYHHIFFSQNARGYAAHLFLSLLATGLFLKGLRQDKLWVWVLYITVMFLNFVALMNSIFVFIAHAIVSFIVLYQLRGQGINIWHVTRRLFFIFLIMGLLVFHFYAITIPQISVVLTELYGRQATGFSPFTIEFLQELVRGISSGFGSGVAIAALPFLLVATVGFIGSLKKDFLLTMMLLLPGVITAIYLVAKGLTVSPRFFLFELFLALICAVYGIINTVDWLGNKLQLKTTTISRSSIAIIILLAGLSAASLNYYYKTPKQAYYEAVEYIEQEKISTTKVIIVFTAEAGIAYYHEKYLSDGADDNYIYVRDIDLFNTELSKAANNPTYIVTTFHRALSMQLPDILNELTEHWQRVKVFPATVGDGNIAIWVRK